MSDPANGRLAETEKSISNLAPKKTEKKGSRSKPGAKCRNERPECHVVGGEKRSAQASWFKRVLVEESVETGWRRWQAQGGREKLEVASKERGDDFLFKAVPVLRAERTAKTMGKKKSQRVWVEARKIGEARKTANAKAGAATTRNRRETPASLIWAGEGTTAASQKIIHRRKTQRSRRGLCQRNGTS